MPINRTEIKIFLTFFLIYSFFVYWATWNEESRFALTKAIVDENRFEIDSYANQTGDRAYCYGHYYSDKEPGTSFLSTFIYYFGKYVLNPPEPTNYSIYFVKTFTGEVPIVYLHYNPLNQLVMFLTTVFSSSIPSALIVMLVYKISKFLCRNEQKRILTTIISGLATPIFSTGLVFWNYSLASFLLFLSFYLLFTRRDNRFLFLSGILLGYSTVCSLWSLPPFIIYLSYLFLSKEKKIILIFAFLLGIFFGLLPLFFYSYFVYILPLRPRPDREVWGGVPPSNIFHLPYYFVSHYILSLRPRPDREVWGGVPPSNIFHLPYVLIKLLFYPERGLFFYYPIFLLSFLGIKELYKRFRNEAIFVGFLSLFFLLVISSRTVFWFSGITFGEREFVFLTPFLMLPLACCLQKINSKLVYILLILSVLSNILGLQALESLSLHSPLTDLNLFNFIPDIKKFNFFYVGKTDITEIGDVLRNPIFEYYLPLFVRNGPRSRIFESLLNSIIENRLSIDIRYMSHLPTSADRYLKYNQLPLFSLPYLGTLVLKIPFLCLVPLSLIIFGIWYQEITNNKKVRKWLNRQRIIIISFVLIVLFFLFFMHVE